MYVYLPTSVLGGKTVQFTIKCNMYMKTEASCFSVGRVNYRKKELNKYILRCLRNTSSSLLRSNIHARFLKKRIFK